MRLGFDLDEMGVLTSPYRYSQGLCRGHTNYPGIPPLSPAALKQLEVGGRNHYGALWDM